MSARLARSTFAAAARRAQTTASSSAVRVSRRTMASSSHGAAKSSDTPWIVGSALIFGPAFLYLVSPSARKNTHVPHDDKHDFPALMNDEHSKIRKEKKVEAEPEIVKDSEGTEADVSSSVALSQSSDSPNDAQSDGQHDALKAAAEADGSREPESKSTSSDEGTEKSSAVGNEGAYQDKGEEGPTNMSKARQGAQEGVPPKQAAESKN